MKLYPFQRRAFNVVSAILEQKGAAILRMDEGLGKTHVGAEIALDYNDVLWVTTGDQKKLVKFREKLDKAIDGRESHIEVVNYQTFGNKTKLPITKLKQFQLVIFDEAHKMRNFGTRYTNRMVKEMRRGSYHFLFMTATPAINSPKDYIYFMNKTDILDDIKGKEGLWAVYERFLNATKIRGAGGKMVPQYEDTLSHAEDFISRLDTITFDITQEVADADMPPPIYELRTVDGEYETPADFTKHTEIRVKMGLDKVEQASNIILNDIKEHGVKKALVLCHFHAVAEAMRDKLGAKCALNSKQVLEEFAKFKTEDGLLVTTMGLTCSDLDLNECDQIYVVESTYSAAMDRQSIRRALRVGKRSTLRVVYIAYPNEQPLLISLNRFGLLNMNAGRDDFRPSSFARLEQCPGSFWYPDMPIEWIQRHTFFGHQSHAALERYLRNPDIEVSKFLPVYLKQVIDRCRELMKTSDQYGIEDRVALAEYDGRVAGSCDFWSYQGKELRVMDYKNGTAYVSVKDNFQLLTYATMICHTYSINPEKVTIVIQQRDKIREKTYTGDIIPLTKDRIKATIDNVLAAQNQPEKHLNNNKCDFFCPAKGSHPYEQGDIDMVIKKKTTRSKVTATLPRFIATGKCFWVDSAKTKITVLGKQKSDMRIRFGMNIDTIPKEDLKKHFSGEALTAVASKFIEETHPEYGSQKTAFFSATASFLSDDSEIPAAGDVLYVRFTVSVVDDKKKPGKKIAFLNAKSIELYEGQGAPEEEAEEVEVEAPPAEVEVEEADPLGDGW